MPRRKKTPPLDDFDHKAYAAEQTVKDAMTGFIIAGSLHLARAVRAIADLVENHPVRTAAGLRELASELDKNNVPLFRL